MAALASLPQTTLLQPCTRDAHQVYLTSVANVTPGLFFWAHPGRELFQVVSLGPTGSTLVNVKRGCEGSNATTHIAGETVFLGRGDQFYPHNPVAPPPSEVIVQPWINTLTGNVYWPTGESEGPGTAARIWQLATLTPGIGPLGVRTKVITPTAAN